jgi:glycine cleavage system H protein
MSNIPDDLRYSAEHEWVDTEAGNGTRIGITTVATDALGDIVYVDLPEAGTNVTAGEVCGEVESTKSVSDLFAPVSGTVAAVNDAVVDDPALVNSDPYGEGWLFTVEVNEEGPLMSAAEYAEKNGTSQ